MMVYAYENHLGGIYFSYQDYNSEDLYCEQCHDYDWLIGKATNAKDLIATMYDCLCAEASDGGYNITEVLEDMKEYFDDIPTLEEAKQIVRDTRKEEGWYDEE